MKRLTVPFFPRFGASLRWLALAGCLVGLPARTPAAPPPAPGGGKPQILIAKLGRGQLNQLWLDATVENVKGAMMIYTGAHDSVLNRDKYGFLLRGLDHKLPPGVAATTHVNTLASPLALAHDFRVGGHDLGASLMALVPERYLYQSENFRYADRARNFDGLMGENFLRRYRAVIDCSRQLLYLNLGPAQPDNLASVLPAHGWTRVPMSDVDHDFAVPCVLNGHHFRIVVDTGAPYTVLDKGFVSALRLHTADLPWETAVIGNDSAAEEFVHSHTLQLGDYTATGVEMTTTDHMQRDLTPDHDTEPALPIIGLLGSDALAFNGAVIDIGGHALYLKHLSPAAKR